MNLPDEFVHRMTSLLGEERDSFFQSLALPAPVSVRLNPFKPTGRFQNDRRVPWCPDGRFLDRRPSFTLDPLFHAGAYYVQEASSMYIGAVVEAYLQKNRVRKVLDLCAAPGGKSTHLRAVIPDDALLVSNEVVPGRNHILCSNLAKWGHPGTVVTRSSPESIHGCHGFFDIVVVDAPCSGEGMFRKDPDAVAEWSHAAVEACALRQALILESAAGLVAPGGLLVYSTCTWSIEEDEMQLGRFTEKNGFDFFPLPVVGGVEYSGSGARFYPHRVEGEGFFVSALTRNEATDAHLNGRNRIPKNISKVSSDDFSGSVYLRENFPLLKIAETLWCLPDCYSESWMEVVYAFNVVASGFPYGTLMGKEFHPAPELALSVLLSDEIPCIDLELPQALRYLRGEALQVDASLKGWQLVRSEKLGLGWGKAVNGRLNNNYPKPWRIRMQLDNENT